MVERLFLTVPRGCLQFVIVVIPDHTHLLFLAQEPRDLVNELPFKVSTVIPLDPIKTLYSVAQSTLLIQAE